MRQEPEAHSPAADTRERLDSWKEIAAFLGRDVRTAMRWAKADGLPVHRIGTGRRRAVYAYSIEIDDWLARGRMAASAAPVELPPEAGATVAAAGSAALASAPRMLGRSGWLALGGMAVLGAFVLAAASFFRSEPVVARASMAGNDIVAFDASGRHLWKYPLAPHGETLATVRADVFSWTPGERPQVLVRASTMAHGGTGTGMLALLSDRGALIWQRTLEDRYTFGGTDYSPMWYPNDVMTYQVDGKPRIAAAWHHHTWWPGVVTTYDRDGRLIDRFVNAGWIHQVNATPDGRYVLGAGVSNALGGVILAVLNARNINGTSPSEGGVLPECSDCPVGAPVAYFLVPWSDLGRPADTPQTVVQVQEGGGIELRALQRVPRDGPIPELIINLSPSLALVGVSASDSFAQTHAMLERQGQVDHEFGACPWRIPKVRKWTPAEGWTDLN